MEKQKRPPLPTDASPQEKYDNWKIKAVINE